MKNTSVNYNAWTVSTETSGEIGERASVTISVTVVINISHHKFIGDANEDCAVQARCSH